MEKKKRGRKESSVSIESDRLRSILKDRGYTITSLAKAIGYDRSGVSTSINKGRMDIGMLEKIGEKLNVHTLYIRGTFPMWLPYADYEVMERAKEARLHLIKWLELSDFNESNQMLKALGGITIAEYVAEEERIYKSNDLGYDEYDLYSTIADKLYNIVFNFLIDCGQIGLKGVKQLYYSED